MLGEMTFAEFLSAAATGNLVPVHRELLADLDTPVSAFLRLDGPSAESFLLESVEGGERVGRYSFLGRDPWLSLAIRGRKLTIRDHRAGTTTARETENPLAEIRALLSAWRSPTVPGLPRFTGGAVGWFGYDTVRWIERIAARPDSGEGADDVVLRFFDTIVAFDHARRRMQVIANARIPESATDADLQRAFDEARARLDTVTARLTGGSLPATTPAVAASANPPVASTTGNGLPPNVRSNLTRQEFEGMVGTALEHIRAGDIFQVVLSQRFAAPVHAAPIDIYRALRAINPSPYMFFLNFDGKPIVGSSPEPLIRVMEGQLEYRPIAGTAGRGGSDREDAERAAALLADEKERAEHVMLVDLGRNDLGRVAEAGSVRVTELMAVEKYSHVMHLVSRLTATLRPECDALDALYACFPAGTVSGAPKVRAMEIIEALEPTRRGLYAGAVGWLDFAGNLDSAIALRTMRIEGGEAFIQAGAGIVADSRPAREYEETVAKARALLSAIELAGSGFGSRGNA